GPHSVRRDEGDRCRLARNGPRRHRLLHRVESRVRGLHRRCAEGELLLMSLLITNGRIITASDDYVADVYCENGVVTAIGTNLPSHRFQAERTIDASGQYVIPGGIDVHTH